MVDGKPTLKKADGTPGLAARSPPKASRSTQLATSTAPKSDRRKVQKYIKK